MRTLAFLALALIPFSLASCGGGDTHESLADQTMAQLKTLGTTLEGVKDKATWEKAKPALEKVMSTLEGIGKKMKDMGKPDEATEKKIKEKMDKPMQEIMGKVMGAGMKLAQMPDIAADVGKFMQDMGKRMEALK